MSRENINLTPNTLKKLEKIGAQIKRARLRRNIGAYAAVLAVLKLDNDLELIGLDEEGKKQFCEANLKRRERASKRK